MSGSWLAAARTALCHSMRKPFSHRGRAVTEMSVVRELKEKKSVNGRLKFERRTESELFECSFRFF